MSDINVTVEDLQNINIGITNVPINVEVSSIGVAGPVGPPGLDGTGSISTFGGVSSINNLSGNLFITGTGGTIISSNGQTIIISGVQTIDTSNFATIDNLYLTGANLQSQINGINNNSGQYIYTGDILRYNTFLTSGLDAEFIQYPILFTNRPSAINCDIENNIDDLIYSTTLGSVTNSGFFIYYSDNLSTTGYKLYITVGK